MFTKPESGWSQLQIEDFIFPVSYLKDTSQDCIDAFCFSLEKHMPLSIAVDGEDRGECIIASTSYETYVIYYDVNDNLTVRHFDINKRELAKEFIKDIEENYEDWRNWLCYENKLRDYDLNKLKKIINVI